MSKLILNQQDFKVLSSETRVSLMKLLSSRPHTASELAIKMKLSAPTVKEHLELLKNSDLVSIQDDGHKWKYFNLSKKGRQLLAPADEQPENVLVLLGSVGVSLIGIGLLMASVYSTSSQTVRMTAPAFDTLSAKIESDSMIAATQLSSGTFLGVDSSLLALAGVVTLTIGLVWLVAGPLQRVIHS